MGLFDRPKLPSDKPKWLREQEIEQEKKIRAALSGLRSTYVSKSPTNLMLQGSRGMQESTLPRSVRTLIGSGRLPSISIGTGTLRSKA